MDKIEELNKLIHETIKRENLSAKDISDGHHTFRELYRQRIILFCIICNLFSDISWKSKKHFDNENDPMFNGDFIAGINTPDGVATFHMKLEYWNLFDIPEIERAPKYDLYSTEDVLQRLLSLTIVTSNKQKVNKITD